MHGPWGERYDYWGDIQNNQYLWADSPSEISDSPRIAWDRQNCAPEKPAFHCKLLEMHLPHPQGSGEPSVPKSMQRTERGMEA
jgi:hypothetical protein